MNVPPFKPYSEYNTLSQALDGNSNRVTLPQMARSGDVIRVAVKGTEAAAIKAGGSTVTASDTADMILLANSVEVFSLDTGVTHVAIDGAAGSTVYITMGTGI